MDHLIGRSAGSAPGRGGLLHATVILATVLFWGVTGLLAAHAADQPEAARDGRGTVIFDETYQIGPTDVLDIQVWKEPDLSRTVPVRPDGKITIPLLNDVQAAGLTPMELKAAIEKGLGQFVENPTVSVGVQEINSRIVYVLGKVNTPGQFPLQQGMTVLQVLSLAGGLAEWADDKNIVILRNSAGKQERILFNYKAVSQGKNLESNIFIMSGDTIVVP